MCILEDRRGQLKDSDMPPTWETQVEVLVADMSLAQAQLLAFGEPVNEKSLCACLSAFCPCLSNRMKIKQIGHWYPQWKSFSLTVDALSWRRAHNAEVTAREHTVCGNPSLGGGKIAVLPGSLILKGLDCTVQYGNTTASGGEPRGFACCELFGSSVLSYHFSSSYKMLQSMALLPVLHHFP